MLRPGYTLFGPEHRLPAQTRTQSRTASACARPPAAALAGLTTEARKGLDDHHQPAQPIADYWDWQLSAACHNMDIQTFYHPAGERWHENTSGSPRPNASVRAAPLSTTARLGR